MLRSETSHRNRSDTRLLLSAALATSCLFAPALTQTRFETRKLLPAADADFADNFGRTVGVDASMVIAGALGQRTRGTDSGAAHVFELDGGPVGPATPVQVADLVPDSVAIGRRIASTQVSVTIRNDLGAPVSGALATMQLTGDLVETLSGVTESDGMLTVNSQGRSRSPLAYTVCVTDLVAALP